MMGAIAGFVALVLIIVAVMLGLKNQKVEVPNFINLNYYDQIEENTDYTDNFTFKLEFTESSTLDNGTVTDQNPSASEKVKKGTEITLTIVQKDSVVIDSSILSMNEEQAKSYLMSRGLIPTIMPEYSETIAAGLVIKTSPEVGSAVRTGSEVVVYIATDKQETTKVPEIEGCSREVAEQLLKASDLEVGTVTEVDSNLEKGVVVEQSIEKDTKVPVGSKIDFTISNGVPSESSVDITVTLPAVNKSGILKIYLNNELFYESKELYLDGATKTYTLTGKGADGSYKVMVDDILVQQGKVDFTKVPAVLSEVENVAFDNTEVLPNVVGSMKDVALDDLNNAGFTKVKVVEEVNEKPAGEVIAQSPTSDGTTKISTSTEIVITVSLGPSEE